MLKVNEKIVCRQMGGSGIFAMFYQNMKERAMVCISWHRMGLFQTDVNVLMLFMFASTEEMLSRKVSTLKSLSFLYIFLMSVHVSSEI